MVPPAKEKLARALARRNGEWAASCSLQRRKKGRSVGAEMEEIRRLPVDMVNITFFTGFYTSQVVGLGISSINRSIVCYYSS